MRRLRWLPLLVLILGAIEFGILLWVASVIGIGWAVLVMAALSLLGAALLRREGVRAWRRLRAARDGGGAPGDEVLDGVVGLGAALLLLIPGFLTALIGLLLLVPPLRRSARSWARRATERRVPSRVAGDLFGPRQVKVTRTGQPAGQPAPDARRDPQSRPQTRPDGPSSADEVIEGEIVD